MDPHLPLPPIFFHVPQYLRRHDEPESRSIHTPLSDAHSTPSKGGLSFQVGCFPKQSGRTPRMNLATSNAVLMSILATYLVGLLSLPCQTFFLLSSCHSQCFCGTCVIITCECWQLIPSIPPTCSCLSSSGSFSFSRQDHTWGTPFRHHRRQGNGPAAFDTSVRRQASSGTPISRCSMNLEPSRGP